MNRIFEDALLDRIEFERMVDRIFTPKYLSNMEFAVCYLLLIGFTHKEVKDHFELSKQHYSELLKKIRIKLK